MLLPASTRNLGLEAGAETAPVSSVAFTRHDFISSYANPGCQHAESDEPDTICGGLGGSACPAFFGWSQNKTLVSAQTSKDKKQSVEVSDWYRRSRNLRSGNTYVSSAR